MKRWIIDATNAPLKLGDFDAPPLIPGTVRIRVSACSLNFADLLMQAGKYQDTPPTPFTPGLEISGVIEESDNNLGAIFPSGKVFAFIAHGGLAETVDVPIERCVALPPDADLIEAATLPIAYGTSHLALSGRANLRAGETLLVFGASGGVGLTAVELGKALGARVIAVARGEEKQAVVRAAGADLVLGPDEDVVARVKAEGGADVIYDPVGGDAFRQGLRCAKPLGRILAIGFASGDVPQIPANHLLVKNVDVIGFYWGGYMKFAPHMLKESLNEVVAMWSAGKLRPHISHRVPFARAPEALEVLRERRATGKVVVEMPR